MSESVWVGKTLGDRYQIQELLGEGGMSAVYKAYDPNLRRVVAVKLIHSHLSQDPQFVRRFEEEAAAVAQLRHENIIQVFDFNHDDSTYFIVFEFVPGESLKDRMVRLSKSGRVLSQKDIISYSASVADALQYAHKRGLIHRDIKPANIMISVHSQAILTDFGIVKIVGGDTHTATGAVLGTARYISPEQVRGEGVDFRTDIYSLGVTIFEMASGQPPFAADSAMTVMMMHVNDPVPDIREYRHDLPSGLSEVIFRAMAKNPDERFHNASEMAGALRYIDMNQPAVGSAAVAAQVMRQSPSTAKASTSASTVKSSPPSGQPIGTAAAASTQNPLDSGTIALKEDKGSSRRMIWAGAAAVLFIFLLCIGIAAVVFGSSVLSSQDDGGSTADNSGMIGEGGAGSGIEVSPLATEISAKETEVQPDEKSTDISQIVPTGEPTNTPAGDPTLAPSPTTILTLQPTNTAAAPPTLALTPTPPPTTVPTERVSLFVQINSIDLQGDSYVVDYTPIGYTPQLPGVHVHFFFNTVPPQNAGVGPTQETWILYGGPNPFTGYRISDRPSGASQMCALVANADHTVQLGTGSCANLP